MWENRQICIINVGMNTSSTSTIMKEGKLPPVFNDLTFIFMPIIDRYGPRSITYEDLGLGVWVKNPKTAAHYDPEFETFTYGDYPDSKDERRPRAANIFNYLHKGDLLFFFANFQKHDGQNYIKEIVNGIKKDAIGFYFIGFFELAADPGTYHVSEVRNNPEFMNNAHCRRELDSAYIIKGTQNSMKFNKAVPFDKQLASKILLTSKHQPLPFGKQNKTGRILTDLSVINSATRASRLIEGADRKITFENTVKKLNPSIKI